MRQKGALSGVGCTMIWNWLPRFEPAPLLTGCDSASFLKASISPSIKWEK